MIRSVMPTKAGKKCIVIGLEAENVRRLQANEPIVFGLKEFDMPDLEVMICYGATGEDIIAEFAAAGMNIETRVVDPENRHRHG